MSNYNKKKNIGRTIAGVLCGVLCVAAVAGAGTALYMGAKNNGWFEKEVVEEDDTVTDETTEAAGSLYIDDSESVSNGANNSIKLTAARLLSSEYEEYGISAASVEDAYTISVTSYNEDATNPVFSWWCSDTSCVTITPSSDTKSCVVTCSSAFSTQITITCTACDVNAVVQVTASCTVDYIKRMSDMSLYFYDDTETYSDRVSWSSSGSTVTWYASSDMCLDYSTTLRYVSSASYSTGSCCESYRDTFTLYSNITGSTVSSDGTTFRELISAITGVSSSLSDSAFKNGVYNALISSYNSGTAAAVFTITETGEQTGLTSTFTFNLIIDPEDFFVRVSSVTLDQTSLYF